LFFKKQKPKKAQRKKKSIHKGVHGFADCTHDNDGHLVVVPARKI